MSDDTAHTLIAPLHATTLCDDKTDVGGGSSCCVLPHPQSLPRSLTRSYTVGGVATDITVQLFSERVVLTCSQLQGRIGQWLLCKCASNDPFNPAKVDWDVVHLLGARDDPLLTVYGKRVAERILQGSAADADNGAAAPPAVLLGLALGATAKNPAVFHTIVDLLVNLYYEVATAA